MTNVKQKAEQVVNDENQTKWEEGTLGTSEQHAKVRKQRNDKGIKRGPRKPKESN